MNYFLALEMQYHYFKNIYIYFTQGLRVVEIDHRNTETNEECGCSQQLFMGEKDL